MSKGKVFEVKFFPKPGFKWGSAPLSINSDYPLPNTIQLATESLVEPFGWAAKAIIKDGDKVVWPEGAVDA